MLSEPLHGWLDERAAMPSPRGVGPAPFSGSLDPSGLVVEDNYVRACSVEVLRELGDRVLEAHDGASALRLLERRATRATPMCIMAGGRSGLI